MNSRQKLLREVKENEMESVLSIEKKESLCESLEKIPS